MIRIRLEADVWYDEYTLRTKGFSAKSLRAARASGALQSKRVGTVRYYKGAWLTRWLNGSDGVDGSRGTT